MREGAQHDGLALERRGRAIASASSARSPRVARGGPRARRCGSAPRRRAAPGPPARRSRGRGSSPSRRTSRRSASSGFAGGATCLRHAPKPRASPRVNRPDQSAAPAIAPSQPSSRSWTRSSRLDTPPAATTGSPLASMTRPRSSKSGPASEPSRRVFVTSRRWTPASAQRVASSSGVAPRRRSSRGRRPVRPWRRSRRRGARRSGSRPPAGSRARLRRCRPSRARRLRGGRSRSPRASGSRRRPAAAHRRRGRDARDELLRRRAGEGAVEVDEVEPAGAFSGEAPRRGLRVAALDRDALANALGEAHAAPLEDVERWDRREFP